MSKKSKKNNSVSSTAAEKPAALSSIHHVCAWLGLVWMAFIAWRYVDQNPLGRITETLDRWFPFDFPTLTVLFQDVVGLARGFGILLGALTLGFLICRRFTFPSRLGQFVLTFVLGLGCLSYLVFVLGAVQFYRPWVFQTLWVLCVGGFIASWNFGMGDLVRAAWVDFKSILSETSFLIWLPLLVVFLIGLIMVFVPECFYDSLVYHLGVPRWYLLEGGIRKFPNLHANYPLTVQMLYLFGLAVEGEIAAKCIHWFCGILMMLGMMAWANEKKQASVGALIALAFLSIPMVQMNLWTTGVDVGVSLFGFAAVWAWSQRSNKKGLLLSAVLAGFCFGSKLTAGLVVGAIALCHIVDELTKKTSVVEIIKDIVLFGLISTAVVSPWLIKAYHFTGNPVFPFLSSVFGGLDAGRMAQFMGESKGVTPAAAWQWLVLPWYLTFDGISGLSYLGPIFLTVIPLTLFWIFAKTDAPRNERLLLLLSVIGMVVLAIVNRLTRYWLPFIAVMFVPAGWALLQTIQNSAPRKILLLVLTCFMACSNILYSGQIAFLSYNPWPVLLGKETRDEFQSYTHPGLNPYPSVKMTQWAKANLPPGSKILMVGEEKVATCNVPFLATGVYDESLPLIWSRGLMSADQFYDVVKKNGVTHIMVNLYEGKRVLGYRTMDWPDETVVLFCDFWDEHVRPIHQDEIPEHTTGRKPPLLLYEILPAEKAALSPVAWNPVYWLYEEFKEPMEAQGAMERKLKFVSDLVRRYPNTNAFQRRFLELTQNPSK